MTIQISGTTVIDQSRNITNVVGYYGPGIASQAEAQAGTDNTQLMTPLRVKQSVLSNGLTTVIKRIQRGSTSYTCGPGSPLAQIPIPVNVPLSSVNTGKAFVSQGNRGNLVLGGQSAYGLIKTFVSSGAARITSSTNLVVEAGRPNTFNEPLSAQNGIVDWEVIEFQ